MSLSLGPVAVSLVLASLTTLQAIHGQAQPTGAAGAPVPCKLTATSLKPGDCVWGAPLQVMDQWLVPRTCRVSLPAEAGKPAKVMLRQGIEVAGTGRTIYLPATDAPASGLPAPGQWLAGEPPLLVFPSGLAAIDVRRGQGEWVLQADGQLAAVARSGDVIALADRIAAVGKQPAVVEFSAVDIGKGIDFGAAVTKDAPVVGLEVSTTNDGLKLLATLQTPKGLALATMALADASGKPQNKDGQLPLSVGPAPPPSAPATSQPAGTTCPTLDAAKLRLILPATVPIQVADKQLVVAGTIRGPSPAGTQAPINCGAVIVGATAGDSFVWIVDPQSQAILPRLQQCKSAPER
jgi:hypothetical protein